MSWVRRILGLEKRASPENPGVSLSDNEAWRAFFDRAGLSGGASGVVVTAETALGIAAFWCGVNFMADAQASLPLQVFKEKGDNGRVSQSGTRLYGLLHDAPNPDTTSFDWRRGMVVDYFTRGAAYSWLERDTAGEVVAIWPLDESRTRRQILPGGARVYHYDRGGSIITYPAADILDLAWMRRPNWVDHVDPISKFREAFGNAIAAERHAGRHFANGGVLPYILTGPFSTAGAASRAKSDVDNAIRQQAQNRDAPVLALPLGHDLKTVGAPPMQSQLVEMQRFAIGQAARFFGLPPAALQDYSESKFTVAEQQDLAIVKHALRPRLVQFEQQLNLRVFGRQRRGRYCEHNVDGLLRGDFKTRSEGLARLVGAGIVTPNEARAIENFDAMPAGDRLYIQGAMVPLERAGDHLRPPSALPPPATEN